MAEEPLTFEERKGRNKVAAAGYRKVEQAERDRVRRELERLARIRGLIAESRRAANGPGSAAAMGPRTLLAAIIDVADEGGQEDLRA